MAFNSSSFVISATTTEQTVNLPTTAASIVIRSLSTNTDYCNVRLGGGSPIRIYASESYAISIETIIQTYRIQNIPVPPQIYITNAAITSNSGTQTLIIDVQEWREA